MRSASAEGGSPVRPHPAGRRSLDLALLEAFLGDRSFDRILEVGCGSGRLLGPLAELAPTVVGLDVDSTALRTGASRVSRGPVLAFVRGDAVRLPFQNGSFSAVVAVRVYHRLGQPDLLLREAHRVLAAHGEFILAVRPRPSWFTLHRDAFDGLRGRPPRPSLTFSRGPRVELVTGDHVGFVERFGETERRLRDAGFDEVTSVRYGFEELPVFGALGPDFWSAVGRTRLPWPLSPSVMIRATA